MGRGSSGGGASGYPSSCKQLTVVECKSKIVRDDILVLPVMRSSGNMNDKENAPLILLSGAVQDECKRMCCGDTEIAGERAIGVAGMTRRVELGGERVMLWRERVGKTQSREISHAGSTVYCRVH